MYYKQYKHFGGHSGVFQSTVYLEEWRSVWKTCRVEDPKGLPVEYKSTATFTVILSAIILKRIVGKEDYEGVYWIKSALNKI
jgi:hypothetical protein